jgi:subtilisin family serine protease
MRRRIIPAAGATAAAALGIALTAPAVQAVTPENELVDRCTELYGQVFGTPNTEPLGPCQWDMALINASDDGSYAHGRGSGVTVGVIDSGVQSTHPDIASNLDMDLSCSFIFDDTPTAAPGEIANGDCSQKSAIEDLSGHGTHVASTIAAPINGVGIAGVAPEATIVALKACTQEGYCFADSVAAALRYAGDQGIDVVNLSLFADPYLYYCKNDKSQKAILSEVASAARYAQQHGVTIVASAGNEAADLQHPGIDPLSPDYPPGSEVEREVGNNCVVAPAELPETLTVSSTGPVGYPGYDLWIADYSSVGMGRVDVTAPGGDFFRATNTRLDAIIAAVADNGEIWNVYDFLNTNGGPAYWGLTTRQAGAPYAYLNGTSMSSPHAAGVAALVVEQHPKWSPKAVQAAVKRTATPMECPADWEPLNGADERQRCYGGGGRTSFFGAGMVDALAAATS